MNDHKHDPNLSGAIDVLTAVIVFFGSSWLMIQCFGV